MSHPLARDAAPLSPETLAVLKREIERKGMSADRLRKQLVPSVSPATFHRALHGHRVSKPVQAACDAMARKLTACPECGITGMHEWKCSRSITIKNVDPAYNFDPDPEAA